MNNYKRRFKFFKKRYYRPMIVQIHMILKIRNYKWIIKIINKILYKNKRKLIYLIIK